LLLKECQRNPKKNDFISVQEQTDISCVTHDDNENVIIIKNNNISIASLQNKTSIPVLHNKTSLTKNITKSKDDYSQHTMHHPKNGFFNKQKVDEAIMDQKIADFIISKGLPFSTVEDPLFRDMIAHCNKCTDYYKPSSRKLVSGALMDKIYEACVNKCTKEDLQYEINVFGLSIMGDGATINKKPLFNIIICGVKCPIFVADIHDCTGALVEGESKTGEFIANIVRKAMFKINDPHLYFDLCFFDGAANVQAAGKVLQAYSRDNWSVRASSCVLLIGFLSWDILRNNFV